MFGRKRVKESEVIFSEPEGYFLSPPPLPPEWRQAWRNRHLPSGTFIDIAMPDPEDVPGMGAAEAELRRELGQKVLTYREWVEAGAFDWAAGVDQA